MMRRLRAWARRILRGPTVRPVARTPVDLPTPAAEMEPEWTHEDKMVLLSFLRSLAGQQLLLILRFKEELLKSNACDGEQKRVDHARGRAVGYHEALASLIVLSAPPPPEPGDESADASEPSAEELRNRLSS